MKYLTIKRLVQNLGALCHET